MVLPETPLSQGRQDAIFAASGVSDGDLVRGVRFHADGAEISTLVLRGHCRTQRVIETALVAGGRLSRIPQSGY